MKKMQFNYNDGGREAAGYKGTAGDCVCRAICIATGLPYQEVYDRLANGNATQRKSKYHKSKDGVKTAARGINVRRKWFQSYMAELGFTWTPTMSIGQGCKVHLRADELPTTGRLVVSVSKHYTSVIDGVLNDTYDCSRDGDRCVYGYYIYTGNLMQEKKESKEAVKQTKPNRISEKMQKLLASQKRWQSKARRAETALKKIEKKIKYYTKKIEA